MPTDGGAPPGVSWRYAEAPDAPALVALMRAAYRGREGWTSESHLVAGERTDEALLLRVIGSPTSCMLVANDDQGGSVACCHLEDRGRGLAYFGSFAVDPNHQAAGIGRWLLGQAEAVAAESMGAQRLELTVLRQQSALIAWYERRGFVATGEARPFHGDARYARPLRDDLEFVVLAKGLDGAHG